MLFNYFYNPYKNKDLVDFLGGSDFSVTSLKPKASQNARVVQRLKRHPENEAPFPFKLVDKNNKTYKLLLHTEESFDVERISSNIEATAPLDFVPNLVAKGKGFLLLEWIEGTPVNMESDEFAKKFGVALAAAHQVGNKKQSSDPFLKELEEKITFLSQENFIDNTLEKQVLDRLKRLLPETISVGMIYADLKAENYCYSSNGTLIFFDLGSFQTQRMLDDYIFGHPQYQKMQKETFKAAYIKAGGEEVIFELEPLLKLMNDIKLAHFFAKSYKSRTILERSKRIADFNAYNQRLAALRNAF